LHKSFRAAAAVKFTKSRPLQISLDAPFGAEHTRAMKRRVQWLEQLFAELLGRFYKPSSGLEINVSFYPYTGLNNTIRLNDKRVQVRLSDILADAPLAVHRALASILVAKLFKKKVSDECERIFREYTTSPAVVRASDIVRRRRGYKQITSAYGRAYNLEKMFQKLNKRYFNNQLRQPVLSWSLRRTKRMLGHHDPVHNTIIISKTLDSATVPEYFVEYVLYHEMLHIKHKARIINGRCYYHTPDFYLEEKRFPYYQEAMVWLDAFTARHSN
jgi:predicted metal-dependent hydrolase